jgi:formylglycine-generating enzyme required for sulfatase activity
MMDYARKIAKGDPIKSPEQDLVSSLGIQIEPFSFQTAKLTFTDQPDEDQLQSAEIDVITVDPSGKEQPPKKATVYYFIEWLSPSPPASLPEGEGSGKIDQLLRLEMMAIPGGTFMMGSPPDETDRFDDEGPQHEVTVDPFFMSKYPVTQAQWRFVAALKMEKVERKLDLEPSHFKGSDRPVEQVSWLDAVEFCKRLSEFTGREYRLPSEAEWEYACRAGTTTRYYFGETISKTLVNYDGEGTTPVGKFPANAFGLHDMHGNVWEWCQDDWHRSYAGDPPKDGSAWINEKGKESSTKVLRGGSWRLYPQFCRSAYRSLVIPDFRSVNVGFRIVCGAART